MTESPPCPEPGGGSGISVVRRDQRGHGDEMVWIGGVAKAEQQGDSQRDQERDAGEEAGQPLVRVFHGSDHELEVHGLPALLRALGTEARHGEVGEARYVAEASSNQVTDVVQLRGLDCQVSSAGVAEQIFAASEAAAGI